MNQKAKWTLTGVFAALFMGTALAADSLSELKDVEVTCLSTVTPIVGSGASSAASFYIANDSATCVRVGGSAVTASKGASIGSGCRDGPGISVDARKAWCISTGGDIAVDVIYGVK